MFLADRKTRRVSPQILEMEPVYYQTAQVSQVESVTEFHVADVQTVEMQYVVLLPTLHFTLIILEYFSLLKKKDKLVRIQVTDRNSVCCSTCTQVSVPDVDQTQTPQCEEVEEVHMSTELQ